MSIRNLDSLFHPSCVALIGAGQDDESIGGVLVRNLFRSGFRGPILPVDPDHRSIGGVLAYPDIASLPLVPDLAVISTPREVVPEVVAALGASGTGAVVVVTAGFDDQAPGGRELRQALLRSARPSLLRVLGPNCLGVMVPKIGLNASFAHLSPRCGDLALVSQSRALTAALLDWADAREIGFSHVVSLGDGVDVDFGDMLDYLALEAGTRAILLYVESIVSARKFVSAARAAARCKPVVVIKAGRHREAPRSAATHSGALAGEDAVYDAAFRRAGLLRLGDLDELMDAVETLGTTPSITGDRLAVLTNGRGFSVLAADALIELGGRLAELSPPTIAELDLLLPPNWSRKNPVDILGDAPPSLYADALKVLLRAPGIDAVLVLAGPTPVSPATANARAVIEACAGQSRAVLTCWLGERGVREARKLFSAHRIPTYDTPTQAIRGFLQRVRYHRTQELLMETPPSIPEDFAPDPTRVRAAARRMLDAGRSWLLGPDARAVLEAYGIAAVADCRAGNPEEAAACARRLDGPVVLKILSADITHKSEVGGVRLDLVGAEAVRDAASSMAERVAREAPDARLEGFTVEPMVRRPGSYELIAGMWTDPLFGPVILFGHGGTAVEVVDDKAFALPPLNLKLARDLIGQTRVSRLLAGARGHPGADLDAIALTLVKLSQLVTDVAEIQEMDINPLVADASGVIALDARIRVGEARGGAPERLAVRPYPKELEQVLTLRDGRRFLLRPVRSEDEFMFQRTFERLTPEEIRLRFFVHKRALSHLAAARLTQIDYDREMALVLVDCEGPDECEFYALVGMALAPDRETAEFGVLVRQSMTGQGLGTSLMLRLIDHARSRGIRELVGDVLRENWPMFRLCESLGFSQNPHPEDFGLVRVRLRL